MTRILVTGGRDLTDRAMVYDALDQVLATRGPFVLVHGGARGADTLAEDWAARRGASSEVHPADWDRHGRAAGHIRNAEMVALGAHLCVAFPGGRGTADCVGRCRRAGIEVLEVKGAT